MAAPPIVVVAAPRIVVVAAPPIVVVAAPPIVAAPPAGSLPLVAWPHAPAGNPAPDGTPPPSNDLTNS